MNNTNKFLKRDHGLLSAYIDGEVSPKDKILVDRMLSEDPTARKVLEEIRRIKIMLRYLPTRKVPRNFTVSDHQTYRFNIPSLAGILRYSTVVSSALLAIVLALDFFSPLQSLPMMKAGAEMVESGAIVQEMPMESDQAIPQMLEAEPQSTGEEIAPEPKSASNESEPMLDSVSEGDMEAIPSGGELQRGLIRDPWESSLRKFELILGSLTTVSALSSYFLYKRRK